MENKFKDFSDLLRENLDSYHGKYDLFIDYSPELFRLLTEILNDKSIKAPVRLKISAAMAYFVAPFDIIPEQIYGPYGYVDDIFVCAYVIKDIENELGYSYLNELWEGEEELEDVIEECYKQSKDILEEKTKDILGYVGLKEEY
ncbi:MAG: YkvA family protein [Methanobacterium sp.]